MASTSPTLSGSTSTLSPIDRPQAEPYPARYFVNGPYKYDVEDVNQYQPGGYHPVHLEDMLDGRYEVFHKLGFGGVATVWLCWDHEEETWAVVKIVAASHSTAAHGDLMTMAVFARNKIGAAEAALHHVLLSQKYFWIDGPNGRHLALVLPFLGPSLATWLEHNRNEHAALRDICRQMATGLDFLHRNGVCHGDFRVENMLMELRGVGRLSMEEMIDLLGEPEADEIGSYGGEDPQPSAPEYAVVPADAGRLFARGLVTARLVIVDFGEAYAAAAAAAPPRTLGIPRQYAAPEVAFDGAAGRASDVWSLGCAVLSVHGALPFEGGAPWETARALEAALGPLPARLRPALARRLREHRLAQHRQDPSRSPVGRPLAPVEPGRHAADDEDGNDDLHPATGSWEDLEAHVRGMTEDTAYEDPIAAALGRPKELTFMSGPNRIDSVEYTMPPHEVQLVKDLVRRMVLYEPSKRISAAEALRHPWLRHDSMDFSRRLYFMFWDSVQRYTEWLL